MRIATGDLRPRNDRGLTRGQCKAGRRGGGTPPYGGVTRGAEEESPSHGFVVPAPFRQGGMETGDADCEAGVRTGFAMTVLFFMEAVLRTVFAGVAGGGATGRKLLA